MPEQEARRLLAARIEERRKWAEFQRIYDRCVAIAEATWNARLDAAQQVQQRLAEEMRDRTRAHPPFGDVPVEIPAPLLTPRDRVEFIARATHALMMGAEKRNLTAMPEVKDAETKPPEGEAPAIEAASGADETEAASDYPPPGLVKSLT